MSAEQPIVTVDMIAVHDTFRKEFAALPDLILRVADGDVDRAGIVGQHVFMMTGMLTSHHDGEDVVLWPILHERAAGAGSLVDRMEEQHSRLVALIGRVQALTGQWMGTAAGEVGTSLAAAVTALTVAMVDHLAEEEADVLPLAADTLTEEEWASIGAHSRAALTPEQMAIGLGVIAEAASPEAWQVIVGEMPPEAFAAWKEHGRPAYLAYRQRLVG